MQLLCCSGFRIGRSEEAEAQQADGAASKKQMAQQAASRWRSKQMVQEADGTASRKQMAQQADGAGSRWRSKQEADGTAAQQTGERRRRVIETAASFEKELTENDINEMLVIPTHFMNNLPANDGGRSVNVTVDVSGTQRIFGYYTRWEGNQRPVFRTGWRNYVRDKGLRAGDKIIFECVNGFPRYKIRAQRQMILFGEEMWGDI